MQRPSSVEEAAALLRDVGARGATVRIRGGGTKPWGAPGVPADVELSTTALDGVLEHNEGDFTAVLQAGVPLARAQERFAAAGQRLALDPPLGTAEAATIGGVVAAGDSGPLRHKYGGPRDLVLGVQVVLSDGTVARSGGKVIKNVAGYDLSKLNTGAFGTLGLLTEVAVRLHPVPPRTASVRATTAEPDALQRAVSALGHARIETEALDVRWEQGRGTVLGQYAGTVPTDLAAAAREVVAGAGVDAEVVEDDAALWDAQRAAQRGAVTVRVSGRPSGLARTVRAAQALGGTLVGRAVLGLSWIALPAGDDDAIVAAVGELRRALKPLPCTVLDAPEGVRAALDPWDGPHGPELGLMRRVKARFDPAGACNRGTYVGGI